MQALDGDTLWISHIGVDPRYRRQGHATRLLLAALTYAPDVPIALAAAPFPSWKEPGLAHNNLRAWYARHGFRPAPRPEDPYYMLLQRWAGPDGEYRTTRLSSENAQLRPGARASRGPVPAADAPTNRTSGQSPSIKEKEVANVIEYGVAVQEDEVADEHIEGRTTDREAAMEHLNIISSYRAYLVMRTETGWEEAR